MQTSATESHQPPDLLYAPAPTPTCCINIGYSFSNYLFASLVRDKRTELHVKTIMSQ